MSRGRPSTTSWDGFPNPRSPTHSSDEAIFDADSLGVKAREQQFMTRYGQFYGLASPVAHAQWQSTSKGPVGLWVHHDIAQTDRSGTLESVLAPMFAAATPERWQAAHEYIDEHAQDGDPVHQKRVKAQITIAGQMARPGEPMSEMLRPARKGRGEILVRDVFTTGSALHLANFLVRDVPWV